MDWLLASLNNPYLAVFIDAKKPEAERGPSWPRTPKSLRRSWRSWPTRCKAGAWIAGGRMTIADIAWDRSCTAASIFRSSCRRSIALERWRGRSAARPAFQKAVG